MSLYLLKISGSDEVENIFEWDGSGSLTAPSGYVFELYTSASVTNYSSSTELELFGGNFAGLFTGELSGSILLNGKTFDEVINGTKYGSLVLLSYSGSNIGLVSSSNGFIVSGSNIKMSLNNLENDKQYNYITTLSSSLSGSLSGSKDSLLRFTQHAGSDKLEYFINSIEITSSGTSSYVNLQVNELYNSIRDSYSTYSASVDIFQDFYYSQWFVDFDLYNRPIVGQIYVNGDKIEKVLGKTKYGDLLLSFDTNMSTQPGYGYFKYSAPLDESPTQIVLSKYLYERALKTTEWINYTVAWNNIFNYKHIGSIITLKHLESRTYKVLQINSIARTIDADGWITCDVTEIDSYIDPIVLPFADDVYSIDFDIKQTLAYSETTVFTASGKFETYTVPSWASKINVICIGGGGGGGGGAAAYKDFLYPKNDN